MEGRDFVDEMNALNREEEQLRASDVPESDPRVQHLRKTRRRVYDLWDPTLDWRC